MIEEFPAKEFSGTESLDKEMQEMEALLRHYLATIAPNYIIDDTGVNHFRHLDSPAEYGIGVCDCGIVHSTEASWYHATMEISALLPHKIIKRCRSCRSILLRPLIK